MRRKIQKYRRGENVIRDDDDDIKGAEKRFHHVSCDL